MQFSELKQELKKFVLSELREDSDDYFEAVISKVELAKLTPTLEGFFGPAVSSLESLPPQAQATVKAFGGIMAGQTLYMRSRENETAYAMLWPWASGPVTIKIIKK